MLNNHTPGEWSEMTDTEKEEYRAEQEKPYIAANGHKLVRFPHWVANTGYNPRPVYSSAWTECTSDCKACAHGEELPDW